MLSTLLVILTTVPMALGYFSIIAFTLLSLAATFFISFFSLLKTFDEQLNNFSEENHFTKNRRAS